MNAMAETHETLEQLPPSALFALVALTLSLVAMAPAALQSQLQQCRDEMQARAEERQQERIR